MSLLAADPHRKGELGIPHVFTSSYTATLNALIRARRSSSLDSATQSHFVAVVQEQATDSNGLPCVGIELTNISQLADGLTTFTRIEGEDTRISGVTGELHKNK